MPRNIHETSTDPRAVEGLDARLRAYGRKSPRPKAEAASRSFSTITRSFTLHPLSGEALQFPVDVVVDFARTLGRTEFLFFDIETTGLGHAEQVYPFLIGYATAESGGAELTTFFAESPAGEEEILCKFIAAAQGKTLVSFNGKSFDLPLIRRRAEKYGLTNKLATLQHIDLYHLIRRIYPEKPARLKDAETRLLGFTRADDIGGAEVAQGYFELLRFGDQGLREKILNHNVWDVLSLMSLLQKVSAAFALAREGKHAWAYKIHRDKSSDRERQKQLLMNSKHPLDARDLQVLGKIFRSEKSERKATQYFIASYRAGYPMAIVDAVRSVRRLGKARLATTLARYALTREDERVQKQLVRYI